MRKCPQILIVLEDLVLGNASAWLGKFVWSRKWVKHLTCAMEIGETAFVLV